MALDVTLIPALSDNYIYLLQDTETGQTAVVDPAQAAPVQKVLDERSWPLNLIINTHHHLDHTGGNVDLKARHGALVCGPKSDAGRIGALDRQLAEGDTVAVGDQQATVFEVPGHTSGHIALWFGDANALFCGDTLFALGCGRLFEGTPKQMWHSLLRLRDLPDDALVYCGHEYTQSNARFAVHVDPDNSDLDDYRRWIDDRRSEGQPTIPASLGREKRTNPFLRADVPALAAAMNLSGSAPVDVFTALRSRKDSF